MEKASTKKNRTESPKYVDTIEIWTINSEGARDRFLNDWKEKEAKAQAAFEYYFSKEKGTYIQKAWEEQPQGFKYDMNELFKGYVKKFAPSTIPFLKDVENLHSMNVAEDVFKKVSNYDPTKSQPIYIAGKVRTNSVSKKKALMAVIFFRVLQKQKKKQEMMIEYITRCWQGFVFPYIDTNNFNYKNYQKIDVNDLFSETMVFVKQKHSKVTDVSIHIVSEGSKRLMDTHLDDSQEDRPEVDDRYQYFPLKYLKYKICTQCREQIASVEWETYPEHAFCGEECAKIKWENFV